MEIEKKNESQTHSKEDMIVFHTFSYDKEKIDGKKIVNDQFEIQRQLGYGSFWNVYLVFRSNKNNQNFANLNNDNDFYAFKEGAMNQISSECFDMNLAKTDSMSFGCNKNLLKKFNEQNCEDDEERFTNNNFDNYGEIKNSYDLNDSQNFYNEEYFLNLITNEETEIRTGLREYHILKKLNHPNICRLYECIMDIEKDKIVLIMEFADLGTLMRPTQNSSYYTYNIEIIKFIFNECLINKSDPRDIKNKITFEFEDCENIQISFMTHHYLLVECARFVFRMLTKAIKYLHDNNIVHRDIKPDNILLRSSDKNLKLADFSISYKLKSTKELISSDSGTPPFKAPESFGQLHIPFKSDIYSFGATIFVFLFNRFKYDLCEDLQDVLCLKNFYPELFRLLKGMLMEDPEKRMSIDEVMIDDFFK